MMFRHSISEEGLNHAKIAHEDRVGLLSRLTFQWIFPLLSVSLWSVQLIPLHITSTTLTTPLPQDRIYSTSH